MGWWAGGLFNRFSFLSSLGVCEHSEHNPNLGEGGIHTLAHAHSKKKKKSAVCLYVGGRDDMKGLTRRIIEGERRKV